MTVLYYYMRVEGIHGGEEQIWEEEEFLLRKEGREGK